MSILDFKGKQANPGPIVIYQLVTGVTLYSEEAIADGDAYIFDPEKTLLISDPQVRGNGQVQMQLQKLSEGGIWKPRKVRVPKTAVAFMHDCGNPDVQAKCQEALSGLVLPKHSLPPA